MKTSKELLDDLRTFMRTKVGHEFTGDAAYKIRLDVTDLMNTAISEGQAMCLPLICGNAGTKRCSQQCDGYDVNDYDYQICRQCESEGGCDI